MKFFKAMVIISLILFFGVLETTDCIEKQPIVLEIMKLKLHF